MKQELIIEEHAFKHGLGELEIRHAWNNYLAMQYRGAPNEGEVVVIGVDPKGRIIQMVGIERPFGVLVYHAMTPPTEVVLKELGLWRR